MDADDQDFTRPACPRCSSGNVWRNGTSRAGKQQYRCRMCNRVFVLEPYIDTMVRELADRMLTERIQVVVIARVMKGHVSKRWIYKRKGELGASIKS